MVDGEISELRMYSPSEGTRLFYLLRRGHSDQAIAESLCVAPALVAHWVEAYHLAKFRSSGTTRAPELQAAIDSKRAEQRAEWVEHVAVESAALSSDGLGIIREKIAQGDARGMNDAARAVNTLVQMARQADGMDSDAKGSKGGTTFNLYVARIGEAGIEEMKRAEPAVDAAGPVELI